MRYLLDTNTCIAYLNGRAVGVRRRLPLANTWRIYDNSSRSGPRLIARGRASAVTRVLDDEAWALITREVEREAGKQDE
jgi:predicted ABC-type ATPase